MTLPASVARELGGHLDRHAGPAYVFPYHDGGWLRAEEWRRLFWRPVVAIAGFEPLRAHDLMIAVD